MKYLITTIAAVVLVGCGESQQSAPAPERKPVDSVSEVPAQSPSPKESQPTEPVAEAATPEPTTAKAPDISIHEDVVRENIEDVKQHLAAGTDVDARDGSGRTSLHIAADFGHKEIAELLITKGADVNARDEYGDTPLDNVSLLYGVALHYTETADLLRKHGGKRGEELKAEGKPIEPVALAATSKPEPKTVKAPSISIHGAAEEGNIEAVKQHLAAGTDVNTKTANGWTPLLMAISWAQKEIAELLIAEGANVNAKNDDGETPLHYAAFVGQKEIAELLIAKGADVNAKGDDGNTPLDVAIEDDVAEIEIADLLRKHGGKTLDELKAATKPSASQEQ